jgi:FixJ family two-component response regulator
MAQEQANVFIVDDDPAMRDALKFMLTNTGLPVRAFESGEAFLEAWGQEMRGCVILDMRMPGVDGAEVHDKLHAAGSKMPVIFLTGHGDVASAVNEMKKGAYDFLTKPVNREALLERVRGALEQEVGRQGEEDAAAAVRAMLATLSPRELEVAKQVAAGLPSKTIAVQLGISERTIANHRANFMRKMKAKNTADLVRKLALAGQVPYEPERE